MSKRWLRVLCALSALACGGTNLNRVQPDLRPPPSTLEFGQLPVFNEKQLKVPLENVGRATLKIHGVALGTSDGVFRNVSSPGQVATGNIEIEI